MLIWWFSCTEDLNMTWFSSRMNLWTLEPASIVTCNTWSRWRWAEWRRGRCYGSDRPSAGRFEFHSSWGWRSPPPEQESTRELWPCCLPVPASERKTKTSDCSAKYISLTGEIITYCSKVILIFDIHHSIKITIIHHFGKVANMKGTCRI